MDLLVKMVEYSLKRCLCYFAVGPKSLRTMGKKYENNELQYLFDSSARTDEITDDEQKRVSDSLLSSFSFVI